MHVCDVGCVVVVAHLHQNVPLGSYSSMGYLGTMVGIRYSLLCQELPTNSGYFPCQKDRVEVHRTDTHLGTGVVTEDLLPEQRVQVLNCKAPSPAPVWGFLSGVFLGTLFPFPSPAVLPPLFYPILGCVLCGPQCRSLLPPSSTLPFLLHDVPICPL